MPKQSVTRRKVEHHETLLCQCGCGQYFDAQYTTRRPRYVNQKHKNKANNVTRIKTRKARIKELFRIRKRAKAEARQYIGEQKAAGKWPDLSDRAFDASMLRVLTVRFEQAMKRGGK